MQKSFSIIITLCLLLAFTACVPSQPVAEEFHQTDIPDSPQDMAVETANPPLNTTSTAHNEQENKPTESPQPTPIDEDKYFKLGLLTIPKAITQLNLICRREADDGTTLMGCDYKYQEQNYRNSLDNHPSKYRAVLSAIFPWI